MRFDTLYSNDCINSLHTTMTTINNQPRDESRQQSNHISAGKYKERGKPSKVFGV